MPTFRHPVLICRDPAGAFSAVAVDAAAVGFGATRVAAVADLKTYLAKRHVDKPWEVTADFRDAELQWHAVAVRPEYRANERVYPAESPVVLRVACVAGVRESGQPAADLPLLGVRFDYNRPADLPDLVRRYTLQVLEGLSPERVNRYLPPEEVELFDLAVVVRGTLTTPPPAAPKDLTRVADAVTDRAARRGLARAWGREALVAELAAMFHGEKTSVLLVGEPGVGKSTLLADAAREAERRFAKDDDAPSAKLPRFWATSAGRLVAGMKYLGQWEERVEEVIAAVGELGGVLCIDRLLDLVRRGGREPAESIAAFLLPYLVRGEVRVATEATAAELDACRRLLPGLADAFRVVPVRAFDRAETLAVVEKQLAAAAGGKPLEVERGTGEQIVRLFHRFQPYAAAPGAAGGFARELVVARTRAGGTRLTPTDVTTRFRNRTGLPELFLRDDLTLNHAAAERWFATRVIDQPAAATAAAGVVTTLKAGLNDPTRPAAVLLFCGPTGVGKTHTARALADYLFANGDDKPGPETDRLVRLDMSEYGGPDAVARLLGPPHGDPSDFIRKVRRQPFCVVLLDEIEKANPAVFDTLMGVFDEGRLTDPYGRVTNFRSAVVVMTSNLGAGTGGGVGFGGPRGPQYQAAAAAYFRPEFFNRMDGVVVFDPLARPAVQAIAARELAAIATRDGLAGVTLVFGDTLAAHLADVGFDARHGARPIQRAVEREVVAPLAKWLLANPGTGSRVVRVDWVDGGIRILVSGAA